LAAQVLAAAGSFPRSFNQNVAFGKITGILNDKNQFSVTYNYQRYRSPHGYFNTPTSTGDGLSLTDGATSHFFQVRCKPVSTPPPSTRCASLRSDYHFDLPASPPTFPAVTIQNPDTGFVFGGNRFQLADTDYRYEFADTFTKVLGKHNFKAGVDINLSHNSDSFTYGPKENIASAVSPMCPTAIFNSTCNRSDNRLSQDLPDLFLFAQDQFRATSRLTLNYGLRYDLQVLRSPSNAIPASHKPATSLTARTMFAPRGICLLA